MNSGQAHAWLFIDLINRHLRQFVDPDDSLYEPEGCGPCSTLVNYWLTPQGRDEAQAYLDQLSPADRQWAWAPGGVIDWAQIEARINGAQLVDPMVMVRKKVYDELIEDQKIFMALQNAGVDNWEGWDGVLAAYREEN